MPTIQEKTARLKAANIKAAELVAAGGDSRSAEAVPVGLELISACSDLAKDFGYEILQPIRKPVDFIKPDPASRR